MTATDTAARIPRSEHPISRKHISDAALKVMARLREGGHQAYLVGGAVRDLLLEGHPKDFDVATDATPERVRALFRNSRIIGRRFRIVHVRFGREIVEVTTFRGHHSGGDEDGDGNIDLDHDHDHDHDHNGNRKDDYNDDYDNHNGNRRNGRRQPRARDSQQSDSGMLLYDNVFGSLEEDAVRRDFTVNALYYCSEDFCVYDHVGGLDDLRHRRLRVIGDAEQRYREDPVRMLRAVRFAAKLGFGIAEDSAAPIPELAHLLEAVPAARLFDESLKLFMAGNALATFKLLLEYQLLEYLFPATHSELYDKPTTRPLIEAAMHSTDTRLAEDKPVTPAFVLAAMLWAPVLRLGHQLEDRNGSAPMEALQDASDSILAEQTHHVAIPRRFTQIMREMWELQLRLQNRKRRPLALLEQRRFRAAYDLLLLRERAGEDLDGLGQFWTELQENNPDVAPPPSAYRARNDGYNNYNNNNRSNNHNNRDHDGPQRKPRRRRRRRSPGNPQ